MNAKNLQRWADQNGIEGIRASRNENVEITAEQVVDAISSAIAAFQRGECFQIADAVDEGREE